MSANKLNLFHEQYNEAHPPTDTELLELLEDVEIFQTVNDAKRFYEVFENNMKRVSDREHFKRVLVELFDDIAKSDGKEKLDILAFMLSKDADKRFCNRCLSKYTDQYLIPMFANQANLEMIVFLWNNVQPGSGNVDAMLNEIAQRLSPEIEHQSQTLPKLEKYDKIVDFFIKNTDEGENYLSDLKSTLTEKLGRANNQLQLLNITENKGYQKIPEDVTRYIATQYFGGAPKKRRRKQYSRNTKRKSTRKSSTKRSRKSATRRKRRH